MTRRPLAWFGMVLVATLAHAETVELDDSRSPQQQVSVQFEWLVDRIDTGVDESDLFKQRAVVSGLEYRLDTSRFVGRAVRVYLHFQRNTPGLDPGGSALLSWRTRGALGDGTATQGERALVFDGTVTESQLGDTFDFTIVLDSRYITGPFRLAPRFVLETQ